MPSVVVDYDNIPKGGLVEVPYLGKFKNGETSEVPQRNWDRFKTNWPGADALEGDTLTLTTKAAKEVTKQHAELRKAVQAERVVQSDSDQKPDETPLSQRKKSELEDLARAAGHDPAGKSKDDLVTLLSDTSTQGA